MGYYINPTDGTTKAEWLIKHGVPMPLGIREHTAVYEGVRYYAVCLVDNFEFTAAGIAYDQRELESFNSPTDQRPKEWFYVPMEKLLEFCPELAQHKHDTNPAQN